MRIIRLLIPLLALAPVAFAQAVEPPDGTRISTAHLSGFELRRLSAALQEEIANLPGTPLNRRQLAELAARIEAEHPDHVAGVRASLDPGGGARVVFVVARLSERERLENVNARYVVEDVELWGAPERDLSSALRDDMHALAGRQLDVAALHDVEARLGKELPEYRIGRRTVRGSALGRVRLIFDARKAEWARFLRFDPQPADVVYHSDQGWGARLPLSVSTRDVLVSPIVAIDVGDELVEEYSGFGVRVETRRLGTERLGAFFEWSSFDQTWRGDTLSALALRSDIPAAYRNRMTVTPVLKVAITRQLSLGGGVSITELDALSESGRARMANAAIGSVTFSHASPGSSPPRHRAEASVVVRAGTAALESDLLYERYLAHAGYAFRTRGHTVIASGMTGRIDGAAPLFERFTLGDSRTLRGWNKYDLAPAGGDRLFHASLEYRYQAVGIFVDAGSVWEHGTGRRVRVSTGLTAHPGPLFLTVGFPLNTDEFGAVFTIGLRFSGSPVRISKY